MESKTKEFDCVEIKRRGAEAIQQKIQGLTPEEELVYWKRGEAEFIALQNQKRTEAARQAKSE